MFAITHEVRASLALAEGDRVEALRLAHAAVEFASRTDFVVFQAEARLALARVLAELGERQDAIREATTALELSETKADRSGSDAARSLLAQIGQW